MDFSSMGFAGAVIGSIVALLLAIIRLVEHNGCSAVQLCCCCTLSVSCQHDLDGSGHFDRQIFVDARD